MSALWSLGLTERAVVSRAQARRRWAVRTGLLLGITSVLLIILVLWRRDVVAMQDTARTAGRSCEALQAGLDSSGLLPVALPAFTPREYAYLSYADRFYAQHTSRPTIIAASPEVTLKLRPNGRSVIVYQSGKVHVEWMTAGAFAEAWTAQTRDAEQFDYQRRHHPQ